MHCCNWCFCRVMNLNFEIRFFIFDHSKAGNNTMPHTSSSEDESEPETFHPKVDNYIVKATNNSPAEEGNEEEEEEASDDSNELIDLAPKGDETVDIEFEFCDPGNDDFHMVRALISSGSSAWIPGVNISDVANDVCEQCAVGSTVKVEGQVYGFLSALSAKYYDSREYYRDFLQAINETCPENLREPLRNWLSGRDFAWLVSERMINLPHQLVRPLNQALLDDIVWAKENIEATGGAESMFSFTKYLVVAPYYVEGHLDIEDAFDESSGSEDESTSAPKRRKIQEKTDKSHTAPQFVFSDHHIFYNNATLKFDIDLTTPQVIIDKAKGAVPQRHRPKHAFICLLDTPAYQKCIGLM